MAQLSTRSRWVWLLGGGLVLPLAQAAASDDFLDMSLEELVDYRLMSMSRKEQRVADMAAAAHVVTAEEIRRSGAMSIPEALRLVPGINVAQIAANRWAVSARASAFAGNWHKRAGAAFVKWVSSRPSRA